MKLQLLVFVKRFLHVIKIRTISQAHLIADSYRMTLCDAAFQQPAIILLPMHNCNYSAVTLYGLVCYLIPSGKVRYNHCTLVLVTSLPIYS